MPIQFGMLFKKMNNLTTPKLEAIQHVFVIEDDKSMCRLIEIILTRQGYSSHIYNNPIDFFQAEPNVKQSIIITDIKMPLMSGVELQNKLIQLGWNIPVIFMSGEASMQQSITAMKQGAFEFLIKPFQQEELIVAVKSAFELAAKKNRIFQKKADLDARLSELSGRERDVYELVIVGCNNTEIINRLGVSLPTAKQYKSEMMRKLQVSTLLELLALQPES
jgi:FixJ family two-component response regulator